MMVLLVVLVNWFRKLVKGWVLEMGVGVMIFLVDCFVWWIVGYVLVL